MTDNLIKVRGDAGPIIELILQLLMRLGTSSHSPQVTQTLSQVLPKTLGKGSAQLLQLAEAQCRGRQLKSWFLSHESSKSLRLVFAWSFWTESADPKLPIKMLNARPSDADIKTFSSSALEAQQVYGLS